MFIFTSEIRVISYITNKNINKRKQELLIAHIEKDKVEEIVQMKLRFFTNISHEFRTPLSLIKGPLERLLSIRKNTYTEDRYKNQLMIEKNVDVMTRLVNQLLDFRSLEQNELKFQPAKHDLNEFLRGVFTAFDSLATKKQIEYVYQAQDAVFFTWFDPEQMEKVVYNLLSNAFKFTSRNGKITLSLRRDIEQNCAVITVVDNGIGVKADETGKVFDRYYQSNSQVQKNYGGTGIGLSLVKGIVEMHNGNVVCTSEEGIGTCFEVRLLIADEKWIGLEQSSLSKLDQSFKQALPSVPSSDLNEQTDHLIEVSHVTEMKRKILIVEDNVELLWFLADIFNQDYKVLLAENGEEGLSVCKAEHPELVVSDLMMPKLDGMEMCRALKSDEEISHIPFILLTAKASDESKVEGFHTGADAYLAKPFNSEVLKANVQAVIRNREHLRSSFQKEIKINPGIVSNSMPDALFLDKILKIIEENVSESDFNVEKLAEIYGISRGFLNRKLKSLTGETSNQFLRNIRLKHAAEFLKQNQWTVAEVTWKVGYNDLRTFRERFRDAFGVSPSEYAKQFKDDLE